MRGTKWWVIVAVTFCMATGFLTASHANEIPDELMPVLIQSMNAKMPVSYHIKPYKKGRFLAENPAQRLRFGFTDQGIEVIAGEEDIWQMRLMRYSIDRREVSLKKLTPKAERGRVEYEHPGMTEWYINSPYGMEQGFTIEGPEQAENRILTLTFEIGGAVEQQGNNLVLVAQNGRRIHYRGLQAFDAGGRSLTSNLSLKDGQLTIKVDLMNASYPVTVDPFFTNETKLTASDGATDDYFGLSVAISGDTTVIGAWADDDNGDDSGSAYVFVRSGATWSEQQKLTASDGAANDNFGHSVSISGETAVIGAMGDGDNGDYSGSAYIYQIPLNDVLFDFGPGLQFIVF